MASGDDAPGKEDPSLPNVRREAFKKKIARCFEDDVGDLDMN